MPAEVVTTTTVIQPTNKNRNETNNTITQNQRSNVACFASDPASNGKGTLERNVRSAIVHGFEREPEQNADGRITVAIQKVSVGAAHPFREIEDPFEARGRQIYPVRANFTTCTDYNSRIVIVKMERVFACYTNLNGKVVCDIIAAANTNIKDERKSINK